MHFNADLLSVWKLDRRVYKVVFGGGEARVLEKDGKENMKGVASETGVYRVQTMSMGPGSGG